LATSGDFYMATDNHDRPLAPRGVRAARRMASYLNEAELAPDLVLCSSAHRAQQTMELISSAFRGSTTTLVERGLYDGNAEELLSRICQVDEAVSPLMVIGHNPALEELAGMLAGDGDDAAVEQLAEKYPTAALAVLTVNGWTTLQRGDGYLTRVIVPRSLD
jgi:phosphohistidine phosphatase